MKIEYLLLLNRLLILNLIVYSESVRPTAIEVTFHALTAEIINVLNGGGIYTVISKDLIAASQGEVLSLLNSSGTSSQVTLSFQPDDIYAFKLSNEVHIIATAHAERSSVHEIAYCARHDSGQLSCNGYHRHTPPTKFVPSVRIDDLDRVNIHAVYYESDYLVYYNVRGRYEDFSQLPENCACNADCLAPVKQPIGSVIVRCDDGPTYLYDLHTDQFFFVSPSEVKLLETSSYEDVIFAVIQAKELCYQDILVETNMVTTRENASAQPFPGMRAISSNPLTIRDLAIVPANETEFGFLIQSNSISKDMLYFKVPTVDLETPPEMKHLPPPNSSITWGTFKGRDDSVIFVEGTNSNGSLVIMVIEVHPSQTENKTRLDLLNNDTQLNNSCVSQVGSANDETPPEPENPDDNSLPNNSNTSSDLDTCSPSTITGPVVIAAFVGLIIGAVMMSVFFALFYRLRKANRFNIEQQK